VPEGDVPDAGWPMVVLIHGGFWRERYRRDLTAPLAQDLAAHGLAAWNIEFRRVEGDGGWPATFEDVAMAIDRLAAPELSVDTSRVAVVGHSAGGHLALWAAGRAGLPSSAPGANPRIVPRGVVGLAPVADLLDCHRSGLSDGAARQLLGGDPDEVADRWEQADPTRMVGHGVPILLVHGLDDTDVPVEFSRGYAAVAQDAGDHVELATPAADHMTLIDPGAPSWALARAWLIDLLVDDAGAGGPAPARS
jgi:acetyl esterase/lipase